MTEIVLICGVILGYFYIRNKRVETIREKAFARVPQEDSLTWTFDEDIIDWNTKRLHGGYHTSYNPHDDNTSESKNTGSYKEAAMVGALGSTPAFIYYLTIDENVMEAIDFAFAADLSNFNNLHDYINEKYIDALGTPSAEGWINRLEGYVTEQYAADVLTRLGHDVQFAENANQEGWDLIVDGQPWQVKGGTDPSKIAEHLEKNPDIPVITSSDLKQYFADNEMVVGRDELDPELLESITTQSLEGIDGLHDAMGLGIPVITLALSSIKEVNLLINDKKEITDSLSSIALDVAGTGGGGLVGAKAGAAIGSVGGPTGVLIGGTIGGVIGAVTGRWATNSIKTRDLEKAKDQYIYQVEESQKLLEDLQESQNSSLMEQFQMINMTLNESKDRLMRRYEAQKLSFDQDVKDSQKKIVEETPNILRSIKEELQNVEKQVLKDLKPNPIRKLLFPSEDDLLYDMLTEWFAKRYQIIDEAIQKFSVVPKDEEGIADRYSEIINFFATHQANSEELHELFLKLDREVGNFRKLQREVKSDMFNLVDQAERSLRSKIKEYFARIHKACEKEKEKINECKEKLRTEAEKLGIDIPGLTE